MHEVIDNKLAEMLLTTNNKLMGRTEELAERIEELEDALEAECALREKFEAEANETQKLVKAVRDYLSWKESPPVGMKLDVCQEIESSFRYILEQILRNLEG